MTDEVFISIQSVTKSYGAVKAVNEVSLDVARGEFFGLLGPSGCGKTTLLRMLAGFEMPEAGEIYIDGQPMVRRPPHERPVNMVFQSYAIFPHLSVRQNIVFGLRKERLSKGQLDRKADEALEMIKLSGFGERRANELSGGQRQRVALARALVKKPKVLLLDEPLGALDKKLREQMQVELRELQKSVGITFMFVTHDQEEALTLSDRIAVMASGEVLEVEEPWNLYRTPRTRFVADFIGNMNFFEGVVRGVDAGQVIVDCNRLGQVRVSSLTFSVDPGQPILVAIRPENVTLSFGSGDDGVNSVCGKLGHTTYLGDRAHVYVHTDSEFAPISVAVQNLDRQRSGISSVGQPVWLRWSSDDVILLPHKEG